MQSFGSIRNNMALKQAKEFLGDSFGFGSIRNNMALKQEGTLLRFAYRFGSIRNNMALKPTPALSVAMLEFWKHSKQHGSKTYS